MATTKKVANAAEQVRQGMDTTPEQLDNALADISAKTLRGPVESVKATLGRSSEDLLPISNTPIGELGDSRRIQRSLDYASRQLNLKSRFAVPKTDDPVTGGELTQDVIATSPSFTIPKGPVDGRRYVRVGGRATGVYDTQTGEQVQTEVPQHIQKGLATAVSALAEDRIDSMRPEGGWLGKKASSLEEQIGPKPLKRIVEMIVADELQQQPEQLRLVGATLKSMQDNNLSGEKAFRQVWDSLRQK